MLCRLPHISSTTSERVACWEAKAAFFQALSSLAVVFICGPRFACHVESTFNLLGHILTKGRLGVANNSLQDLAMMHVNKTDVKGSKHTCNDSRGFCPACACFVGSCVNVCLWELGLVALVQNPFAPNPQQLHQPLVP